MVINGSLVNQMEKKNYVESVGSDLCHKKHCSKFQWVTESQSFSCLKRHLDFFSSFYTITV